jgi:hypothetical protein
MTKAPSLTELWRSPPKPRLKAERREFFVGAERRRVLKQPLFTGPFALREGVRCPGLPKKTP